MKPLSTQTLHDLAWELRDKLNEIAAPRIEYGDRCEQILLAFKDLNHKGKPISGHDKCSVFWILDNGYMKMHDYNGNRWHAVLRQVRNDPTYGTRLFEGFR